MAIAPILSLGGDVDEVQLLVQTSSSAGALRQSILSLLDQGVVSAANFATGLLIGRGCSKEEFGIYMLGATVVLFLNDLQASLILTPFMVFSPRLNRGAHAVYAGSTLIHQMVLSAGAMITLMIGATLGGLGYGPKGLSPVMWTLVGVITLLMLREYARRLCFAGLQMRAALILDSCIAMTQVGGLLVLYRLKILSASRAYWVVGLSSGIVVLGWMFFNSRQFALRPSRSVSDLKRNWSFGKWVFLSGLVWTFSMGFYPWILTAYHGTGAVGVWSACLGVASLGNPLLLGGQNYLGPKIAHVYADGGASALRPFVLKSSALFSVPMWALSGIMLVTGGPLVALLYGSKYAGNDAVVVVLTANLVFSSAAFVASRALFAIERADLDFLVNFVALFVLLFGGVWLTKSHSALGAAWGMLLANAVSAIVRYVVFLHSGTRSPSVVRAAEVG